MKLKIEVPAVPKKASSSSSGTPAQRRHRQPSHEMSSAQKLRKALITKSKSAIKKSKHNHAKKPYSEACHAADLATAAELMSAFVPMSSTKIMDKWLLGPEDVSVLLPDRAPAASN